MPMAPHSGLMPDLELVLLDEAGFDDIPDPAQPGARCQTCDYWERLDGGREAPAADATDAPARASLKRRRLLAARDLELPPWNKGRYGTALGRAGRAYVSQDADGHVWVAGATVTCLSGVMA